MMEVSIENSTFSVTNLNYIRESVEKMNKFNQVEILRILHKNNVTLNENKSGVHVNLSEISNETLDELYNYIKYVNAQEVTLNKIEKQKLEYKNTYFSKDIKDK